MIAASVKDEQRQLWRWVRDMQFRVSSLNEFRMTKPDRQNRADPDWPADDLNVRLNVPVNGVHALQIELLVPGGRASPEKLAVQRSLNLRGYRADVCIGWINAARTIVDYLGPTLIDRERRALHAAIPMS